jgi:hypothetical protein
MVTKLPDAENNELVWKKMGFQSDPVKRAKSMNNMKFFKWILYTVRNIFIWIDGKGTLRKKNHFSFAGTEKNFFSVNSYENFLAKNMKT